MMSGQQFSLSVLYTVQMYSELMCVGPGGLMQASLEKAVQSCTHHWFIQHACTLKDPSQARLCYCFDLKFAIKLLVERDKTSTVQLVKI